MTDNEWDGGRYDDAAGFVTDYGDSVVDLLDPRPGERILDLGCGTGHLTATVADAVGSAGDVLGIDASSEMIRQARAAYPDLRFDCVDATAFETDERFDAVFSNAALHWIDDQDAVSERVAAALAPNGRYVAELGASGNVAAIVAAVRTELRDRGYDAADPWYFPTIGEHATLLERHGFAVRSATVFDRPTDLDGPDGLREWLAVFGDSLFAPLSDAERAAVVAAVEDRLRPEQYDPDTETWTADYRRLRFVAVPGESVSRQT
ncbi:MULTISPECIES: class I SAM-dependent methyltransferase [Halomicrobium]|uniref:Methyltransferase type 11 n=2 Tax=Halomicrobium mukohataei TaxID=57705 RepID=C7P0P3_HALMD|nr:MULTISPECIES: class I SAM-dependent methyltransferase [Halomicrobium]ACV47025.1 Methyltransferase type 11 [Halomicrobium mukohataei DSM 12286]QCD65516.1 methyltransferase domain-containing protein [Halomicrobium mukohataei]QFR20322.1 methyltransferase domain-containing protein [Halomicrobium sp. ZPS1]